MKKAHCLFIRAMPVVVPIIILMTTACQQDYVEPKEPIDDELIECEFAEDCILMPVTVCLSDKSMVTYGAYARCIKNNEGINECKFFDSPVKTCEGTCDVNTGKCSQDK